MRLTIEQGNWTYQREIGLRDLLMLAAFVLGQCVLC